MCRSENSLINDATVSISIAFRDQAGYIYVQRGRVLGSRGCVNGRVPAQPRAFTCKRFTTTLPVQFGLPIYDLQLSLWGLWVGTGRLATFNCERTEIQNGDFTTATRENQLHGASCSKRTDCQKVKEKAWPKTRKWMSKTNFLKEKYFLIFESSFSVYPGSF